MPEIVCKEMENKTGLYSNIFRALVFLEKAVLGENSSGSRCQHTSSLWKCNSPVATPLGTLEHSQFP